MENIGGPEPTPIYPINYDRPIHDTKYYIEQVKKSLRETQNLLHHLEQAYEKEKVEVS